MATDEPPAPVPALERQPSRQLSGAASSQLSAELDAAAAAPQAAPEAAGTTARPAGPASAGDACDCMEE